MSGVGKRSGVMRTDEAGGIRRANEVGHFFSYLWVTHLDAAAFMG